MSVWLGSPHLHWDSSACASSGAAHVLRGSLSDEELIKEYSRFTAEVTRA